MMEIKKPTLNDVKRIVSKANGGVKVKASWSHRPTLCKDFDGNEYYSAVAIVESTGFRTKKMCVQSYPQNHQYSGIWVQ